nr:hypothetical protein [Corallococcus coralloides]
MASGRCLSAWMFQGVDVRACPDGEFRQTVSMTASALARGAPAR